jgi:hypothetical protein
MPPPGTPETTIALIKDYYAKKVDVVSQIKTDDTVATEQLGNLKLDHQDNLQPPPSTTPKTEQEEH